MWLPLEVLDKPVWYTDFHGVRLPAILRHWVQVWNGNWMAYVRYDGGECWVGAEDVEPRAG